MNNLHVMFLAWARGRYKKYFINMILLLLKKPIEEETPKQNIIMIVLLQQQKNLFFYNKSITTIQNYSFPQKADFR